MQRFPRFALLLALAMAGCTVIVEDQLQQKDPGQGDAGPQGEVCQTTAQCLGFSGEQNNCRRICQIPDGATDGRCVQLTSPMATPDGIACGLNNPKTDICVEGACVERRCGDRFRDRLPEGSGPAEYCDDGANGNPDDGCNDECTRPCGPGLPLCTDEDPCNGAETCVEGMCHAERGLVDGTPCSTPTIAEGVCMAQRCVAL